MVSYWKVHEFFLFWCQRFSDLPTEIVCDQGVIPFDSFEATASHHCRERGELHQTLKYMQSRIKYIKKFMLFKKQLGPNKYSYMTVISRDSFGNTTVGTTPLPPSTHPWGIKHHSARMHTILYEELQLLGLPKDWYSAPL
uniref:AlNc14C51G4021 protein n=1 Tax=Albugo laibachii Nc14 TaxID=890382 RepID=F0WBH4_9STRA|nr:AlNc14C51G4021 [Albugo laibachii Nc14]|eukprot:CCA18500.1 AlNc14C51G4021 [Albugo laibachii Nc14]